MFYSILFPGREQYEAPRRSAPPECFADLLLEGVFAPILKAKQAFDLDGFFHTSLRDPRVIVYRQDVMRELEDDDLRALLSDFSAAIHRVGRSMEAVRADLDEKSAWRCRNLARGRMLDHARGYCRVIRSLAASLPAMPLRSAGLRGFCDYLAAYCASKRFTGLCAAVERLEDRFSGIEYCMHIKNGTIRVRKYEGEADHCAQILACFEKFRQGEVKDYRKKLSEEPYAAHVEDAVLGMLAGVYKDVFAELGEFCGAYLHFDDETVLRFSREIQFYLSWLDFVAPLRREGLPFCYPKLCSGPERLFGADCFDLALARIKRGKTVLNSFALDAPERILVVTGPNQGGKTTFARAFGQMHHFASLGLCVPGREAALYLFDEIFTHFGREEDLSSLNGKLRDDLVRLRALLERATERSIIIVNEIFASTTLGDALALGGHMMDSLRALGAPAVLVTFLDELALRGPETVSMMSTVHEDDPTQRTYRIVRKPPDGLAYAMHIAGRHGLTYEKLSGRLKV